MGYEENPPEEIINEVRDHDTVIANLLGEMYRMNEVLKDHENRIDWLENL